MSRKPQDRSWFFAAFIRSSLILLPVNRTVGVYLLPGVCLAAHITASQEGPQISLFLTLLLNPFLKGPELPIWV